MISEPEQMIGRSPAEWRTCLTSWGEPAFRASQVFRWIHRKGVFEPEGMTDLQLSLRQKLTAAGMRTPGTVSQVLRSKDGTRKLLLELREGARIECVLIPMVALDTGEDAEDESEADAERTPRKRVTLCVSSQFGCAMGCVFCASGRAGLMRGLSSAEIVSQVYLARRYLEPDEDLRNLVFMGMGEPLHHYDATVQAIRLLTHGEGQDMSLRRLTVSTVGLVPGIERLGRDFQGKVGLAVSVHAPNDALRDQLVPMNRRYPLAQLMAALRAYPLPKRRRITIEYTLIRGMNDQPSQARELAELLRGLPVKINLIPVNTVPGSPHQTPSNRSVQVFQDLLTRASYSCFVRTRRGDEVDAACGQLAMPGEATRKTRALKLLP